MADPAPPFEDPAVHAVFAGFEPPVRERLMQIRALIFSVAGETPEVGSLVETLKWGQPAYLPKKPRVGTTIRLGVPKTGGYAVFTHCQTSLISDFRVMFDDVFDFDGNRAVLFDGAEDPDMEKLASLVRRALTYHLKGRPRSH